MARGADLACVGSQVLATSLTAVLGVWMKDMIGSWPEGVASHVHSAEFLERTFRRRRLLALGAGTLGLGTLATTLPSVASAQPPAFEAMLLMCIDPRFVHPVNVYMDQQRGLVNHYSHFRIGRRRRGCGGTALGGLAQHILGQPRRVD